MTWTNKKVFQQQQIKQRNVLQMKSKNKNKQNFPSTSFSSWQEYFILFYFNFCFLFISFTSGKTETFSIPFPKKNISALFNNSKTKCGRKKVKEHFRQKNFLNKFNVVVVEIFHSFYFQQSSFLKFLNARAWRQPVKMCTNWCVFCALRVLLNSHCWVYESQEFSRAAFLKRC